MHKVLEQKHVAFRFKTFCNWFHLTAVSAERATAYKTRCFYFISYNSLQVVGWNPLVFQRHVLTLCVVYALRSLDLQIFIFLGTLLDKARVVFFQLPPDHKVGVRARFYLQWHLRMCLAVRLPQELPGWKIKLIVLSFPITGREPHKAVHLQQTPCGFFHQILANF